MNSMADQLKKAGIKIPPRVNKIDSSKANWKARINDAKKFLAKSGRALSGMDNAPDSDISYYYIDSVVLNYERYCEAIKDILLKICDHEKIPLSSNKSFSEVIRKTYTLLSISNNTQKAINKLSVRNNVVHDYMNSDYYDDQVITNLTNDFKEYENYIVCIEIYCNDKGLV